MQMNICRAFAFVVCKSVRVYSSFVLTPNALLSTLHVYACVLLFDGCGS